LSSGRWQIDLIRLRRNRSNVGKKYYIRPAARGADIVKLPVRIPAHEKSPLTWAIVGDTGFEPVTSGM